MLGDREDAADAVQDAFLSAHRGAAAFRGDAQVGTWLHRVVVNACLDRLRRRPARPVVPWEDGLSDRCEAVLPPPSEDRLDVAAALAELPDDQRVALVLVELEDRPVAEVAAQLGIPVGTVKSRCARGRAHLAVRLGHLRPVSTGKPAAAPGGAS